MLRFAMHPLLRVLIGTSLLGLLGCGANRSQTLSAVGDGNSASIRSESMDVTSTQGPFTLLNQGSAQGNAMSLPYQSSSEGQGIGTYWAGAGAYEMFNVLSVGSGQYEIAEVMGNRCLILKGSVLSITSCTQDPKQLFSFKSLGGDLYQIQSASGLCLSSPQAFATVLGVACDAGALTQKWLISGKVVLILDSAASPSTPATPSEPTTPSTPAAPSTPVVAGAANDGAYLFQNASVTDGNEITVSGGVSSDGNNFGGYWSGGDNIRAIQVQNVGNSQAHLVENIGNRCLTVKGADLTMQNCANAASPLFTLLKNSDGTFLVKSSSGLCLTLPTSFAKIDAEACSGKSNQNWKLVLIGAASAPVITTPTPTPKPAPSEPNTPAEPATPASPVIVASQSGPATGVVYALENIQFSQQMAVAGGSAYEGNSLVTWSDNTGLNQRFKAVVQASGLYELQEQSLGYCLSVVGSSLTTTKNCTGASAQLFNLTKNSGDGSYQIQANNGSCVTAQGAYGGVNSVDCVAGNQKQKWYFEAGGASAPSTPVVTAPSDPTPADPAPANPVNTASGALPKNFRLMTLGDSMTGGYGAPEQQGYRGPLYDMLVAAGYQPQMTGLMNCGNTTSTQYPLPADQQNCDGSGGIQIADLDAQVVVSRQAIVNENPDVVLLWVGFNSVYYTGNTIAQDQAQLAKTINDILIQKPTVRVIVAQLIASTQCCGTASLAQYNAGIPGIVAAKAAQGYQVSMVNLYGTASNPLVPPADLYDYVHPNAAGYVIVANAWLQAIKAVAGASGTATSASTSSALPAPIAGQNYAMTFDDEFSSLNTISASNVFNGAKWYNGVDQCCMGDSTGLPGVMYPTVYNGVSVNPYTLNAGGGLNINLTKKNNVWYSGILASVDSKGQGFSQQYGYYEIRAKLPSGQSTWPSFWLLNTGSLQGSTNTGEIDVFEQFGQFPNNFCTTFHDWGAGTTPYYNCNITVANMETDFHTWGLLWTESTMTVYFDDKQVLQTPTPAVMKQPYFMLMDLGVGGGWPTDQTPASNAMQIQYVHVYQLQK